MKNTNNNGKKRINKVAVAVASLVLATSTAISAKTFSASAVSKNAIYDIHACQAVKIPVKINKNAIVKNKKLKTAATSDNVVKKIR